MTKTAKRGRPAAPRSVGRPAGKAKKTSDAQRIRNILERFGVELPVAKVKAKLAQANNFLKGKAKVKFTKALDVKIAIERRKLREKAEATEAPKARKRGRPAKVAAVAPVAETAPVVETPVVVEATPVVEVAEVGNTVAETAPVSLGVPEAPAVVVAPVAPVVAEVSTVDAEVALADAANAG